MSSTPRIGIPYLVQGQSLGEITQNNATNYLETFSAGGVISRGTSAQPGSPSEGDLYILPASPTGSDWSGQGNNIALYYSGWLFVTPTEGMRLWINDEDILVAYDGTNWSNPTPTTSPPAHVGSKMVYDPGRDRCVFLQGTATTSTWLPQAPDTRRTSSGSFTTAVLTLTLSAPASSRARTSSTVLTPPPTVSGVKTTSAVRRTTSRSVPRAS